MQASSEEFSEEEILEEEFVEEDGDEDSMGDEELLAFIKSSLQDEYQQRRSTKETLLKEISNGVTDKALSVPTVNVAPDLVNPTSSDASYIYEEVIVENSFNKDPTESFTTLGSNYEYSEQEVGDEVYIESIASSMQQLFLERKAENARKEAQYAPPASPACESSNSIEDIEEEEVQSECDYEEQIIERWFSQRNQEPEDLEAACRILIPIIYKGDNICAATMMRRTPLPELYRYLKQHYDYKKEIRKDLTEEETESGEAQVSLEDLWRKRSGNKALPPNMEPKLNALQGEQSESLGKVISRQFTRVNGLSSPRARRSPWGKTKKGLKIDIQDGPFQPCASFDDSQVIYEEISVTDNDASCLLLGGSECTFEEFIEETESYEVEVEESVHEGEEHHVIDSEREGGSEVIDETRRSYDSCKDNLEELE